MFSKGKVIFYIILIIEPIDSGVEQTLKLRLSTTLGEVKLPVYSKDTIATAKKKLQVCTKLYILSLFSLFCINYSFNLHG